MEGIQSVALWLIINTAEAPIQGPYISKPSPYSAILPTVTEDEHYPLKLVFYDGFDMIHFDHTLKTHVRCKSGKLKLL